MTRSSCLLALLLSVWAINAQALPPRDSHHLHPKHARTAKRTTRPTLPSVQSCKADIDPGEAREIVILKMQQRMDCLENKLNYLSEQLSLQSGGAVRPFVEPPKDYVIQYPRPDAP